MLLQSRNAIIYGGGGAIGGAVARAFAREGAKVFLAGRTLTKLDAVAEQIRAVGGYADTAQNPLPGYNLGGLQVAFGAIESLRRNLACELGPYGIRVVTLQTGGVPESISASFEGREVIAESIAQRTMLKRAAMLDDVGNAAVFAASDWARSVTAAALNITCGAQVD